MGWFGSTVAGLACAWLLVSQPEIPVVSILRLNLPEGLYALAAAFFAARVLMLVWNALAEIMTRRGV